MPLLASDTRVLLELFALILTPVSVGAVLSNSTELEFVTAVTLVPAFPAVSLNEITKLTSPSVSPEFAVY